MKLIISVKDSTGKSKNFKPTAEGTYLEGTTFVKVYRIYPGLLPYLESLFSNDEYFSISLDSRELTPLEVIDLIYKINIINNDDQNIDVIISRLDKIAQEISNLNKVL